jgi:putative ABC transport system permease protein
VALVRFALVRWILMRRGIPDFLAPLVRLFPFDTPVTCSRFARRRVLAMVITAVGLYGVLGYFVNERTPEIAVRRALGAPGGSVVRFVVTQRLIPVLVGIAVGATGAFAGTRYLASLLFGVEARDLVSFVGAAVFLLSVALVATLLPA